MSKQDTTHHSYTPRRRRKTKRKPLIFPIFLAMMIVYSLGVFSSPFVAAIKPSFVHLAGLLTLENKQEEEIIEIKYVEDIPLSQHFPGPETLIAEEVIKEEQDEKKAEGTTEVIVKKANFQNEKKNSLATLAVSTKKTKTEPSETVTKPSQNEKSEEAPAIKQEAKTVVNHVVQAKETLFSITMKYYLNSSYQTKVAEFNDVTDPMTDIKAGMLLKLPDPLIIAFHEVKQGETLFSITMKYYEKASFQEALATYNKIKDPTLDVKAGMVLHIPSLSSLEIHPKNIYSILINKKTNNLIVYMNNEPVNTFPIATGKDSTLTPEGTFKIVNKVEKPWFNPENIPGGDSRNPLGSHWLGLNVPGTNGYIYGIHGTNNPTSIGSYASQGCIRMLNSDIQWLYENIPLKTQVTIIND